MLWFPFLFSYHNDGVRTHLGFGPFDLLFHYSTRTEYVPTTDSYEQTWRWSWGTMLQGHGVDRESGESSSEGIHMLLDGARIQYFGEWMDAYDEAKDRRGWSGY